MALRREELNRKLLHVFSGSVIPLAIFYLPWIDGVDWRLPAALLGVSSVVFVTVELLRMRVPAVQRFFRAVAGHSMREHEDTRATGATYIVVSSFICSVAFAERPEIAVMALSSFILGDAVAAVVGQTLGRTKIGSKSLEGSAACFALCMLLFVFAYPALPGLLDTWGGRIPLVVALGVSAATTVLELFPVPLPGGREINDNLTVPLLTGALLWWLQGVTVGVV